MARAVFSRTLGQASEEWSERGLHIFHRQAFAFNLEFVEDLVS